MAIAENEIEFVEVNGTKKKFADTTARQAVNTLGETVSGINADVEENAQKIETLEQNQIIYHNQIRTEITSRCTNFLEKYKNGRVYASKANGWAYVEFNLDNFSSELDTYTKIAFVLPEEYRGVNNINWINSPGLSYTETDGVKIVARLQLQEGINFCIQEINNITNEKCRFALQYPLANP